MHELDVFIGLALTPMVLAAVYIAALMGGLVEELIEAGELVHVDRVINQVLTGLCTDTNVGVFAFITGWANALAIVAATPSFPSGRATSAIAELLRSRRRRAASNPGRTRQRRPTGSDIRRSRTRR